MNPRSYKPATILIASVVAALVCILEVLPCFFPQVNFFQRLELITYDWRMRLAASSTSTVSTNFGFAFIADDTIAAVSDGSLGYRYGLYWPRHIYGRVAGELSAQGARAIGFDVLFGELRPDHAPVLLPNQTLVESDEFFAQKAKGAGNVILATTPAFLPPELFRTNCLALGDISAERDFDGVLRRAQPFRDVPIWHPLIKQIAREIGFNLPDTGITASTLTFRPFGADGLVIQRGANGEIDLNEMVTRITGEAPEQALPKVVPFEQQRIWQLGIVLAAKELECDLNQAIVNDKGVTLPGKNGRRNIPIDREGNVYISWLLQPNDPRLTIEPVESLLQKEIDRAGGDTPENRFEGKLVFIGSTATGNDLSDHGATPLENDTFLVSKHWNIANSVLTGSFIQPTSTALNLLLIVFCGTLSAYMTMRLRAVAGSVWIVVTIVVYITIAAWTFLHFHLWIPIILPVAVAMLCTHICLVVGRARYEQKEKRRIKSVFTRIVSPNVVNELLKAENLQLGGARREITIYFADVRGFTEMTDSIQVRAEEHVRKRNLSGQQAEAYYNEVAAETLATVNLYLGAVADMIKTHKGTLDKYIGDCVMAFWGAPTANEQHALYAVRAAIDAQRAIDALNQQRAGENERRRKENISRTAAGQPPLDELPQLALGSGINTGTSVVGLMGSEAHLFNYTVFGREVNLASRLEGVSGRGRIIIGEATHTALMRDDPKLAATCVELPAVTVKGIRNAVKIYEVPWKIETVTGTASTPALPARAST